MPGSVLLRLEASKLIPATPAGDPTVMAPDGGGPHSALASMALSFRVTQYANQTGSAYTSVPPKAVHAVIPKSVFPADIRDRIAKWLRP